MDPLSFVVRLQHTWWYTAMLVYFAWYPLLTSCMWIFTAIIYYARRESLPEDRARSFYGGSATPTVSFVIPAFNEQGNIGDTLAAVLAVDYPCFDVLVVDDSSTDATLDRIRPYLPDARVKVLHKRVNEGKAMALNDAIPLTTGELVFVMDADAEPAPDILRWLVPHFASPRCAAVTGNPRVANRDSFLAKLQAIEFASIISLMRRAQRVWGRIMTMSGVVGIFRRSALFDVGLYSPEMATEDIDLTWRLQLRHWDVRYEANAIMWMRVPQSLAGLVRQRRRWAVGLSQVLVRHTRALLDWKHRRFWPVLVESYMSVTWAYAYVILSFIWLVSYALGFPPIGASPIPNLWGMLIATICLGQLVTGVVLDRSYDARLPRYFVVAVLYPLVYWILLAVITFISAPRGLNVNRQKRKYTLWKPVRE